jgi:transposase
MYIRTISRKNKDGSQVTYVQLAHNVRDKDKGFAVAKVLYNFGRIEDLDIEQLNRLVKSITRFLDPEKALKVQTRLGLGDKANISWKACRSYGGIFLLDALWEKLRFRKIIEDRVKKKPFKTPMNQAIFAMVGNRCLAPKSKLAVSDWVENDIHIPGLPSIDVQVLYRAMDFLLEFQSELEQEIYWAVSDLMNLEVDLLFFDTTSTYFETEKESTLKNRGYSKDKRKDLPQVVIGLAVNREGIPVKHWVFPGNTADMNTIETIKKDLCGWKLNRCVIVHDAGMSSEENLKYLQRGGGHYIVGRKLKTGEEDVLSALSHKGPYTEIKENLFAKDVTAGTGEKRKRLVLVKNTDEEKRAREIRSQIVDEIEKRISRLNSRRGASHTKAVCELKSHPVYGKYVKELEDGRLSLDKGQLSRDSRYDGKFLVETSDDSLSIQDIVLGYKQLYDVEDAFRTLKTTLELRPNYHSKDERIRCHIFLCFLALVIARIVENKSGKTWSNVRREMSRIYYGEFMHENKTICQITALTPEQKSIMSSLGIKEPSTIVDIR